MTPSIAHRPALTSPDLRRVVDRALDLVTRWLGPEAETEAPSLATVEDTGGRSAPPRQRSVA